MAVKFTLMSPVFHAGLEDLILKKGAKNLKEFAKVVSPMGNVHDLEKSAKVFALFGIQIDLNFQVAVSRYHGMWFFDPIEHETDIYNRMAGAETKPDKKPAATSVRVKMMTRRLRELNKLIEQDNEDKTKYARPSSPIPPPFAWTTPSTLAEVESLLSGAKKAVYFGIMEVNAFEKWWRKTVGMTDADVMDAAKNFMAAEIMEE
jgi:hypothetical protein